MIFWHDFACFLTLSISGWIIVESCVMLIRFAYQYLQWAFEQEKGEEKDFLAIANEIACTPPALRGIDGTEG